MSRVKASTMAVKAARYTEMLVGLHPTTVYAPDRVGRSTSPAQDRLSCPAAENSFSACPSCCAICEPLT
jgi:hypothetical protein